MLEVIFMQKQYQDLYSLIQEDKEAGRYYSCLPGYVKDSISQRAENVNSFDTLRDYAENLTRADD